MGRAAVQISQNGSMFPSLRYACFSLPSNFSAFLLAFLLAFDGLTPAVGLTTDFRSFLFALWISALIFSNSRTFLPFAIDPPGAQTDRVRQIMLGAPACQGTFGAFCARLTRLRNRASERSGSKAGSTLSCMIQSDRSANA